MIRLLKMLEWRAVLKRYQKANQPIPLFFHTTGAVVLYKVTRVGWATVEVEMLSDESEVHGIERHVMDLEDLGMMVTRYQGGTVAGLSRQMPELAALALDPEGEDDPDAEYEYDEDEE